MEKEPNGTKKDLKVDIEVETNLITGPPLDAWQGWTDVEHKKH